MTVSELYRINHTRVDTFRKCRKQFHFAYVSGLAWPDDPQSPSGIVGSGVHRAMKFLTETGDPDVGASELERYLRMPDHEVCGEGTDWHGLAFQFYDAGCVAHESIASEDRWAEKDTYRPATDLGIILEAKADRVDRIDEEAREWLVIDWKTNVFEDDDSTDAQLDIAHVAARTTFGRMGENATVRAIAWNLRTGRQRVRTLLAGDVRKTLEQYAALARRIQSNNDWEATPGRYCRFCRWRPQCPEGRELADGYAPAATGSDDEDE